jgi:hypothetical protein
VLHSHVSHSSEQRIPEGDRRHDRDLVALAERPFVRAVLADELERAPQRARPTELEPHRHGTFRCVQRQVRETIGFHTPKSDVAIAIQPQDRGHELVQQVEDVRAHVHQHAPAALLPAHPAEARERPRVRGAELQIDRAPPSERTAVQRRTQQPDRRQQSPVHAHGEHASRALRDRHHLLGVGGAQRHGLLDEDVSAPLHPTDRPLGVEVWWCG